MDPVTLDICRSRLIGVVNEQATALVRTSFTSIVRAAGDELRVGYTSSSPESRRRINVMMKQTLDPDDVVEHRLPGGGGSGRRGNVSRRFASAIGATGMRRPSPRGIPRPTSFR